MNINQAPNDKITYSFIFGNLNSNTITSATVQSNDLTVTGVSNTQDQVTFTVESGVNTGAAKVNMEMNLSNGDVYSRCVNFTILDICF